MDIHRRDAAFRIEPAAQGAPAVDNRHADVAFRWFPLFKPVHRLPAGQAGDAVNDRRAGAGGDIDDLFAFDGVELKRAAPAAGAFLYTNTGHDVAPDRCTFWES